MSEQPQPPRPKPPVPRPPARRGPAKAILPPAAGPGTPAVTSAFGRVAEDGTVYVTTADGERAIGSYPGATPNDALAYFMSKYDTVAGQVALFEQRLVATDLPLGEIDTTLAKLKNMVTDLKAVGDLDALQARVAALIPIAAQKHQEINDARKAARVIAAAQREELVIEAEKIAGTPAEKIQWRADGNRMKELFDLWKAAQKAATEPESKTSVRIDRRTEEEMWKRFSHARTAFDRKRRHHFAQLDELHGEAKVAKEKLIKEAEALQSSKEWATTAASFKRLMDQWKNAGRAARKDDEELWARFKAAQDTFFAARHAVLAEQDAEFAANLEVKLGLLTQAEALLPITDLEIAKSSLREIQAKWDAAGKVPRADLERTEQRMRAVEQAVRGHEEARWRQHNPEAQARARSAVEQLEVGLAGLQAKLERASEQGNDAKARELTEAIQARTLWLDQARQALRDFGG